jgi:hypothetical protein
MTRGQWTLYSFRGKQLTLVEISRITGIRLSTLQSRATRGISFERPLRSRSEPCEPRLRLTGDRDRDLKAIITARHRDVIRRHQRAVDAGLCDQCT